MLSGLQAAFRDQAVLIDEYFFLCLSMVLTGFVTVFEWDSLFPDQKEFYNLTPLPIKPYIIFFAKMIALLLFVVLFNVAINALPALMFPSVVLTKSSTPGTAGFIISNYEVTMYHIGHAMGVFLSSLFVFTILIASRALFLLIIPAKMVRTVSRYMQLALILVFLCALFSNVNADRLIMEGNAAIYFLPPFWFLGLYEVLIGHHNGVFNTLAMMAWMGVAIACFISILTYAISYRLSMQKGFQSAGLASYPVSGIGKIWTRILHKTFLRGSMERASFHFISQTVFRRQDHMLYWGSFIAVGIASICVECYAIRSGYRLDLAHHPLVLLSFPLIMSFFLLIGLRHAFSVPADLNANWVFKVIDKPRLERAHGGAHKFMVCAVNIPFLIIFVPFYLMIWGPRLVFLHLTYVSVLSLILIEVLLLTFEKLPFTCSYIPGKANIILRWPAYVLACALYSFGMAGLARWILQDIKAYITFVLIAGVVIIGLSRYRSSFLRGINAIQFEEEPEKVVNVLTIEG
jgi:hypothetical protein